MLNRRRLLQGVGSAAVGAPFIARAQGPTTLKLSHQFPGGTLDQGDFRDRLCRRFAAEVERRSGGELRIDVYAGSSLMKTYSQFGAMRKGALDMSLFPMPYAGGEVYELNIGLMPALVSTYEEAAKWKDAAVGRELTALLDEKGIVMLTWVWQAGGCASRGKPVVVPEDVKGLKIRGGSHEIDVVLSAAGGIVSSMPSNELYLGMQTGALEATVTSSTSLISFRMEELARSLTTGRGKSYWFMCEPVMMSKAAFGALPTKHQDLLREVGASLEAFGTASAKADDEEVARLFAARGAQVVDLGEEHIEKWRTLARATAWRDYAAKSPRAEKLMRLAEAMT